MELVSWWRRAVRESVKGLEGGVPGRIRCEGGGEGWVIGGDGASGLKGKVDSIWGGVGVFSFSCVLS